MARGWRGVVMSPFAVSITLLVALSAASYAQSPCACPGPSVYKKGGGGQDPLTWGFEVHQEQANPAPDQKKLLCYLREVVNHSGSEVRDVRWDVARFRTDGIQPKGSACNFNEFPGEMNPRDSQGPLNHGITSHAYDTVVRQPESGWAPKQAQAIQAPEFTARQVGVSSGYSEPRWPAYTDPSTDRIGSLLQW